MSYEELNQSFEGDEFKPQDIMEESSDGAIEDEVL